MTVMPFTPAWWLPGAHAQTLGARLMRSPRGVQLRRERLELADGDFIDLDWATHRASHDVGDSTPVVVVLHGLEGSARSKYALEAYRQLLLRGVQPVGFNFRSCSGELNRKPRLYHSGETGDLELVLRHLRQHRQAPLGAIGFSLGGNVLLKYLGEHASDATKPVPDAAVAISVPFDLAAGADHIERGMSKVYRWYLLRKLKRKVAGKRHLLNGRLDIERALRSRSFRAFDDAGTAPLHGFPDAADYYARSSSNQFLAAIRVPTLLIQAEDDPFLPAACIPRSSAESNPAITTRFVRRGGHVGFVAGSPWDPQYWAEASAAEFVTAQLHRSKR